MNENDIHIHTCNGRKEKKRRVKKGFATSSMSLGAVRTPASPVIYCAVVPFHWNGVIYFNPQGLVPIVFGS
jgi:hypothetical protein